MAQEGWFEASCLDAFVCLGRRAAGCFGYHLGSQMQAFLKGDLKMLQNHRDSITWG